MRFVPEDWTPCSLADRLNGLFKSGKHVLEAFTRQIQRGSTVAQSKENVASCPSVFVADLSAVLLEVRLRTPAPNQHILPRRTAGEHHAGGSNAKHRLYNAPRYIVPSARLTYSSGSFRYRHAKSWVSYILACEIYRFHPWPGKGKDVVERLGAASLARPCSHHINTRQRCSPQVSAVHPDTPMLLRQDRSHPKAGRRSTRRLATIETLLFYDLILRIANHKRRAPVCAIEITWDYQRNCDHHIRRVTRRPQCEICADRRRLDV